MPVTANSGAFGIDVPQIWLLTDDKPGHRNQLRGLADRLRALSGAACHWLSVADRRCSLWQCWRGANLAPSLPAPTMAIAAGSGTHRALLATGRHFRCPVVLLMKPNFPYAWLDAAIVPAHDQPPSRSNVLATRGALNAVMPVAELPLARRGLMLIGGESSHFGWNRAALIRQILVLCGETPDWQWVLTDSRRTPAGFMPALAGQLPGNLELIPHADTSPEWLPGQLAASRRVWVTPDSVSMVYESLTAGVPTGLFDLPDGGQGRVVQGVRRLLDDGLAMSFADRAGLDEGGQRPGLWEAERAARWLVARFPNVFPGAVR
jgi:mitochondrial fission protein ELM1